MSRHGTLPPFQPKKPMPSLSTSVKRSSRRLKIFPNYVRIPTTNAASARLRLKRKDQAETQRQLDTTAQLGEQLKMLTERLLTLQNTLALQCSYLNISASPATAQPEYHSLSSSLPSALSPFRIHAALPVTNIMPLSSSPLLLPLPTTHPPSNMFFNPPD